MTITLTHECMELVTAIVIVTTLFICATTIVLLKLK